MYRERINSCDEKSITALQQNAEIAARLKPFGIRIPGYSEVRALWYSVDYPPESEQCAYLDETVKDFGMAVKNERRGVRIKVKRAIELVQSVVSPEDPKPFLTRIGSLDPKKDQLMRQSRGKEFNWRYKTLEDIREINPEDLAEDIGDCNADLLIGIFGSVKKWQLSSLNLRMPDETTSRQIFVFAAYPIED